MQYTLVKNIFSRKNRFEVMDIHEHPIATVSRAAIGLFSKVFELKLFDADNIEIKQYYKGLRYNYAIYESSVKVADLNRKYRFFRSYFWLDCLNGNIYKIECDSLRKNYTFFKEEEIVATLKRKSRKMRRSYELTCLQMEDQSIILASVVALDAYFEQNGGG
ncbi:MAG: hypothetical protein AAF849_03425 [Bacteroidota bacterium]